MRLRGFSSVLAVAASGTICVVVATAAAATGASSPVQPHASTAALPSESFEIQASFPAGEPASLNLTLPQQLQWRLTTLAHACAQQTAEADPSSCPAASDVGRLSIRSASSPTPLEGDVRFVALSSASFPELYAKLGSGASALTMTSETSIAHGHSAATIRFSPHGNVKSLELTLPQGPGSALVGLFPPPKPRRPCGAKVHLAAVATPAAGAAGKVHVPASITSCRRR